MCLVGLPLPQESDAARALRACQWARPESLGARPRISRQPERVRQAGSCVTSIWRCLTDATTLVTDLAIFLVGAAVVISVVRAWRARPTRAPLAELPSEVKNRYAASWERIEKRFLEALQEATQEADALVLAMLGERGHPLGHDRLPRRRRETA